MTTWSNFKTFEDWKSALADLLKRAEAASEANDTDACETICDELLAFVRASPAAMEGTNELDGIAVKAQLKLSRNLAKGAVDEIRSRTSEMLTLGKAIETVAAQAEANAADLRLEATHAALDSMTGAVRATQAMITEFKKQGFSPELVTRSQDLIKQLEWVQSLIKQQK